MDHVGLPVASCSDQERAAACTWSVSSPRMPTCAVEPVRDALARTIREREDAIERAGADLGQPRRSPSAAPACSQAAAARAVRSVNVGPIDDRRRLSVRRSAPADTW